MGAKEATHTLRVTSRELDALKGGLQRTQEYALGELRTIAASGAADPGAEAFYQDWLNKTAEARAKVNALLNPPVASEDEEIEATCDHCENISSCSVCGNCEDHPCDCE